MQQDRRTTPYPRTWEIPLTAAMVTGLVLVLAAHLARATANALTGTGWALPPQAELFTSLPALLGGDSRAGLTPAPAAPPALLYTCLAVDRGPRHRPARLGGPAGVAGVGSRHGFAGWPPAPRPRPCSDRRGCDGSPRLCARTGTATGGTDEGLPAHRRRVACSAKRTNRAAGSCGCRGTGPPVSSGRKDPARRSTCSSRPCSLPPAPRWSPSPRPTTCCCPSTNAPAAAARWPCSTRSGSPPACPSWSGTPSPGAWTRWSPNAAPRPSPPEPSAAPAPAARVRTPHGSTPPKPPRSSRRTSTPPP